jgi:hypothetical protein
VNVKSELKDYIKICINKQANRSVHWIQLALVAGSFEHGDEPLAFTYGGGLFMQ